MFQSTNQYVLICAIYWYLIAFSMGISMVYSPPFKQHDAAVSWRLELEVFRVYVGWEDGHMPFV